MLADDQDIQVPPHMTWWRSAEGLARFAQIVRRASGHAVPPAILCEALHRALMNGEHASAAAVRARVDEAARTVALRLAGRVAHIDRFDKFVHEPQPSRQGEYGAPGRAGQREEMDNSQLGRNSRHDEFVRHMRQHRR